MERRFVLAALVALCACAEPPPLRTILDPLVDVRTANGDRIVDVHPIPGTGPGYRVTFAKDKGFPSSLFYEGNELTGTGECPYETLVGTAIYPALTAAGEIAEDPASLLTTELAGPAVARLTVTYSVPYMCNSAQHHLRGTSTFTFFPLGRMARFDDVTANDSELVMSPEQCGCTSSDSTYFFTSYWSFRPDGAPVTEQNDVIPNNNANYDKPIACFHYDALGVHIGVRSTAGMTRVLYPDTVTINEPIFRFVQDFQREATSIPANAHGESFSTVQLVRGGAMLCAAVVDPLEDAGVRIAGNTAPIDRSGIYADLDGKYGRTISITVDRPAAAGFVISLKGLHEHLRVTRANTDDQYYVPQLDRDNDRTLVWFRDEMLPGDHAEIELLE